MLKFIGSSWTPSTDETGPTYYAGEGIKIIGTTIKALTGSALWNANKLQDQSVSTTNPSYGEVLKWNGSKWSPDSDNTGGSLWSQSGSSIYYNAGKVMVGTSSSSGSLAFEVKNNFNNGAAIGAYDYTNSTGAAALFGYSNSWSSIYCNGYDAYYAGCFGGDEHITGDLTGGKGGIMIDDPLDPQNKYLYHSFVESPDMMNVYNGNVTLNDQGEAIIELPKWFEALNKDFRYQLTCIGGFAPVYIAEKITGNSFKIAGGSSGMEVSWQVTGIRHDPFANKNRIQVEVDKAGKEKGHYMHYIEYNQPFENSIEVVNNPLLLKDLEEQNMEDVK